MLLALLLAALPPEPSLAEVQAAAARLAGGEAVEDQSRVARARGARWAPQLHVQGTVKDDTQQRDGQWRGAPVQLGQTGAGRQLAVGLSWDFAQLVYTRDEAQLALAHAHLARLRRDASVKAAELFIARRTALAALPAAGPQRRPALYELLELTARLDALTNLFGDALAALEAACAEEEKK